MDRSLALEDVVRAGLTGFSFRVCPSSPGREGARPHGPLAVNLQDMGINQQRACHAACREEVESGWVCACVHACVCACVCMGTRVHVSMLVCA